MKIASLSSGGKDSSYALWLAMQQGHEITHVVAMIPRRDDSWLFHFPNIKLIDQFAESSGLPLIKAETSGKREREFEDLKQVLKGLDVDGVVSGAIASNYQKSRIDHVCEELGLVSVAPLWGKEPVELLRGMLRGGFEVIITSVAAEGFQENWLERRLDEGCVKDLERLSKRYGIDIAGEGGEYDSLVLDAHFFSKRIEILEAERVWKRISGYLLIKKARLVEK